jgi:hypothetical protein
MARFLGRCTAGLLSGLLLLALSACKRPETALRERPAQRIELVQEVQGMTPLEEQALVAQLSEGLGLPSEAPDPAGGPVRIFRITLKGQPDASASWGLGKTWLASTGQGSLVGLLFVPMGSWQAAAIGTGAGTLLGAGYGPVRYRNNQVLLRDMGYLPWVFTADWDVLERRPSLGDSVIARGSYGGLWYGSGYTTHLDLRPHLQPLPADKRSPDEVRQASLRAYGEALILRFQKPKRSN